MRYFVCSESELIEAINSTIITTMVAFKVAEGGPGVLERAEKAKAACRARPVERVEAGPCDIIYIPMETESLSEGPK